MEKPETSFTKEQFEEVKTVRVTCGSISLAFDTIAFAVFLYLVAYHRSRVNRPSLRLAAFSCLANLLENLCYIIMIETNGPSKFCNALQYIADFMIVLGVTLLALIGINLVLVYVVNFRSPRVLEYIYYPYAIIYSGCGLIGPIIQNYIGEPLTSNDHDDSCWYINSIQTRYHAQLNFMWVYGFIFFSTVVALICSIIAIIKIVIDSHLIVNLFKHRPRAVSSQLPQVIIRCLLYPLGNFKDRSAFPLTFYRFFQKVPLVSNFIGFLMQCLTTIPGSQPSYPLTMANGVLRALGGLLVALIFLNDPVVTDILSGWYNHWYCKHIQEYVIVETKANEYVSTVDGDHGATESRAMETVTPIILVSFPKSKRRTTMSTMGSQSLSLLLCCCSEGTWHNLRHPLRRGLLEESKDSINRNDLVMGVDCEELTRSLSNAAASLDRAPPTTDKIQKIPMRKLKVPNETVHRCLENRLFVPNILMRRTFSKHIVVEEPVNGYFIVVDEDNDATSHLFVYYPSVPYAKLIYFLFNNPIGKAFYKSANVVVDVDISVEPLQESQPEHRLPASDFTNEL